ncbi:respiratory chain complex I subunit 1 family protein [Candidatus Acetothermia bacterium]|nr:respiratory chain complex I subunit 1 family protein [Candidatus Acetothermia bacterium]
MNFAEIGLNVLVALSQLILFLLLAPLVTGWVRKVKAFMQNRSGPGVWQPYFDLVKLLRKEVVVSQTTSWIFTFTPYLVFTVMLAIGLLIPFYTSLVPLGFIGDAIAVIYLLALARFFTALAGLDAASAFGGLGSSREMSLAAIIEPAMMLAIFTVAVRAGSTSLSTIVQHSGAWDLLAPPHLLASIGFFIIVIAETGRIPVDNPATHLELTMIHEAMILEYSGRYLALIEWASSMKLLLFLTLLANIFLPGGIATQLTFGSIAISLGIFLLKVLVLATLVALVECSAAKLRLFRVPDLLAASFVLSLLALVLYFLLGGAGHAIL